MRKISIINQKGGVGKTTTTINLAKSLSMQGKKVLILDMDAQGNIAACLGVESRKDMFDILVNSAKPDSCIVEVGENLDLISSRETLTKAEIILVGEPAREKTLSRKMKNVKDYDFIIIDCPPSLGLLNQNVLLYSDEVIVPVSTDPLGIYGLGNIVQAVSKVSEVFNHDLKISMIVPTLYDQRSKVCKEALRELKKRFPGLVASPIRVDTKLKEAPRAQQSIFEYSRSCRGAKDYKALAKSVLNIKEEDAVPVLSATMMNKASVKS
ncbi:MAG: ParA family protein [Candidatus Nanoarchaeia archaeon]